MEPYNTKQKYQTYLAGVTCCQYHPQPLHVKISKHNLSPRSLLVPFLHNALSYKFITPYIFSYQFISPAPSALHRHTRVCSTNLKLIFVAGMSHELPPCLIANCIMDKVLQLLITSNAICYVHVTLLETNCVSVPPSTLE
jgi:Sec-independent protein secretion pathway component TatC